MKQKVKGILAAVGLAAVLGLGLLPADGPGRLADLASLPDYDGMPHVELNGGEPAFTEAMLTEARKSYETYSQLDHLGRPGTAAASVGPDLMPEGERESIGMIRPVGFSTVRYDDLIEDKYLYNRCHIIGWQLTGENANPQNLLTGTRYMNVEGMLPFENAAASYVRRTGNHVLYRVTPVYSGEELLCRGLVLEARSVEDDGEGLQFHVFVYNVQPGIEIDYATGDSWRAADSQHSADSHGDVQASNPTEKPDPVTDPAYILNKNSLKFHLPSCESVSDMKEKNKIYSDADRDAVIGQGYVPCRRCNP